MPWSAVLAALLLHTLPNSDVESYLEPCVWAAVGCSLLPAAILLHTLPNSDVESHLHHVSVCVVLFGGCGCGYDTRHNANANADHYANLSIRVALFSLVGTLN